MPPVFTDEHDLLRRTIRAFVEKEVTPHVDAWEEAGRIPRTFWRRLGELGFLVADYFVTIAWISGALSLV